MKLEKVAGAVSEIWQIFIQDSSSTTGAGLTGLAFNTGSLTAYYHRDTDTTATAITLATMTVGTFTSSGFKEIDATNMPGWYQFCPPNAALAVGAKSCAFHLKGAANMAPLPLEVQLTAVNPDDGVRYGMTALPNAAAEAAGGLFTRGTGAGQIEQEDNGKISINVKQWLRGTIPAVTITGVPIVDLKYILGTVLTETAGLIAAAFSKFFNKASPTGTVNSLPDVVPGLSGGVFIAGANAPITISGSGTAVSIGSTGSNGSGLVVFGNGTGSGILASSGLSAGGAGIRARSLGGNNPGFLAEGDGSAAGGSLIGGATGAGLRVAGGATSGNGIDVVTTDGHGVNLAPVGSSKHGLLVTGGNAGTSDGIKAVAGTGGVDLRANITGNLVGTVSVVSLVNGLGPDVIDATSIATDAIGANELAASAITEIQAGLATAASIAALNNLSAAQVNAEVVDAIAVDTYAEPGQGTPAATTTLAAKINLIYKALINRSNQTSSLYQLFNNAATVVDQKATVSDDGTTFESGKKVSGP